MPPKFPLSLGHETAGIVVDKNKSNFKNYSNVIIDPLDISACKKIEKELCGCGLKHNLCTHQTYLGSHPTKGSFREYMVLKKSQLTTLDKKINPKISSMIEPAGIAQYCIDRAKIDYSIDSIVNIEKLKSIQTPTLLIWGAQDLWIPLDNGIRMNRILVNSKLEVIENSGHVPMEENPQESLEILKNFLF